MKPSVAANTWLKRIGGTALLSAITVIAGLEISETLTSPRNWEIFITPIQLVTVAIAFLLCIGGLFALVAVIWLPLAVGRFSVRTGKWFWLKWSVQAVCQLFIAWFFLYSPWQVVFVGLWMRVLFLLGLAQLFSIFAEPREKISFGYREIILGAGWLLYIQSIPEIRLMTTHMLIYRGATLAGIVIVTGIGIFLHRLQLRNDVERVLLAWRKSVGWLILLIEILFVSFPVVLLYVVTPQNYALYPYTRLTVFVLALFPLAVLLSPGVKLTSTYGWLASTGLLLFSTSLVRQLVNVINHPFSLYWSEGNRFYDYSLSFASNLYDYPGKLIVPYFSPARYALWGSLFLIPGLPIWVHRLWNAFLVTMPALVVGWLMIRAVRESRFRLPLMLWITLFILLGEIQANLLVSLLLFLPFIYIEDKRVRGVSLVATSILVGLNRWTWIFGPAAWGALVDLFLYYPKRKGNFFTRVWPTVIFTLLGLLPGLIVTWSPQQSNASSLTFKQPLLWYRLWPNATYAPGILVGVLFATGPLVCLLIWLVASRRWKLDWLQTLTAGGAVLGFLGAGTIISTKIGGGGDLHNLDLFLITLALLTSLAAYDLGRDGKLLPALWSRWTQILLAAILIVPGYAAYQVRASVKLPPQDVTLAVLDTIQSVASDSRKTGEILFMDQRQLLTFGYIKDIPFVPAYEKKYMMDQAMAGNAPYFLEYYQDLANQRFSLIVTEPLNVHSVGRNGSFGEENDAWVKWVSAPTLCFYKPLFIFKDIGVELLVPNPNTEACARYLIP